MSVALARPRRLHRRAEGSVVRLVKDPAVARACGSGFRALVKGSMDIIEVIQADHDEVAALFDALSQLAADDRRTNEGMRLAVRLAVALKTHARAEEKVLYEAIRTATVELSEFALEGPYEHQVLDVMIDKLVMQRPGCELKAILKVAREMFEHHARIEEEGRVLPLVKAAVSGVERAQLGDDMLAMKRRIRPQIERMVGPATRGTHDGLHIHHTRR